MNFGSRKSAGRHRVSGNGELPGWMFALCLLILAWNGFNTLRGAVLGGISWDEPNHVFMLQGWFETGYYAEVLRAAENPSLRVFIFGPVSDLIGHLAATSIGVETWANPTLASQSYFVRHLATALVSFAAVGALVVIGRILFSSWRWGFLAGAILVSIPMWSGLAMFDQKDIGVAAGLTVYSLGLILLISDSYRRRRLRYLLACGLMSLGTIVAVGTRISMIVPIALMALVGVSLAYVHSCSQMGQARAAREQFRTLSGLAIAGALAYVGLLAIYPLAFGDPLTSIASSMRHSSSVLQSDEYQIFPERPPRTYVPQWYLIQTPLIIVALSFVGTVAAASRAFMWRPERSRKILADPKNVGFAIVLVQALAIPILAVAFNAILFHSIRHLLFIYPAVALLSATGVWSLLQVARSRGSRMVKLVSRSVVVIAAIGMIVPTIDQARLFPYGYAYFNPAARLIGIDGRWATDYWRLSWRELYSMIPNDDLVVCPDTVRFPDDIMYDWPRIMTFSCAFEPKVNPFFTAPPSYNTSSDRFWFLREFAGEIYMPRNCTLFDRVSRPLGLGEITLGYLGYCQYVQSPEK